MSIGDLNEEKPLNVTCAMGTAPSEVAMWHAQPGVWPAQAPHGRVGSVENCHRSNKRRKVLTKRLGAGCGPPRPPRHAPLGADPGSADSTPFGGLLAIPLGDFLLWGHP